MSGLCLAAIVVCFVLDLGVGGVRGTDLIRALNPRDPSFSGGRLLTGVASGGLWSRQGYIAPLWRRRLDKA